MSAAPRICALLPAYNEAGRIQRTIGALRSRPEIGKIVVADDGSKDETARLAREAGADVVLKLRHGGKGAALTQAYRVSKDESDIFLLLDSDLGASATESLKLLRPVVDGKAEMTVAVIPPDPDAHREGRTGGHGFVVRLARDSIERRTGQLFAQPLSGQRAVRREVLEAIGGEFAPGFGVEVALTIATLKAGFRVLEVSAEFRHAVTASDFSGILHRARQYVHVARAARG